MDPKKIDYYLALGNFYLRSGLKSKALSIYHHAVEHIPDSDKLHDAIKKAGG